TDQSYKRGVVKVLSLGHLLHKHPFVIMLYDLLDNTMLGSIGLNDHFAFLTTPACPTRHLLEQRKSTFVGPEVRKINDTVCIDNTDKAHTTKIQSLSHHLCTDQYIKFIVVKSIDNLVKTILPFCRIQIQSTNP